MSTLSDAIELLAGDLEHEIISSYIRAVRVNLSQTRLKLNSLVINTTAVEQYGPYHHIQHVSIKSQ